ncbi:MAG: amino acid ABC transporter permease [Chloroflexi bacterium]|nr:amino acid ABC transporter permease [Chloroflexota bacterium]MBT5972584.1 amino acid ABC transporter permease [Desulfobacula sp.]
MTIIISLLSMFLGMIAGMVGCSLKMSRNGFLRTIGTVYIEIARGIPNIVAIFWFYYGLPIITGITFSAFTSGVVALSLKYGGYIAEIYRAGIEAVKVGQKEAAYSVGFSEYQTMRRIVFPQAFRIAIPTLGNVFVGLLQNSALLSVIGVADLMRKAELAVSETWRPFEIYTTAAVIYLTLTVMFSRLSDYYEKKTAYER